MKKLGVLMISHGDFAKSALSSAELIVGKQEDCATMGVFEVDNIQALHEEMHDLVKKTKTESGLVVLTDMLGGTPMNMALTLLEDEDIVVCAGFNMPVLLEVLMNRHMSLDDMKTRILETYDNGLHIKTKEDLMEDDEDDLL